MTYKSFRSAQSIPSVLFTGLFLLLMASTASMTQAKSICEAALPMLLPGTELGYAGPDGSAVYSVDLREARWLVVEAQSIQADSLAVERPSIRMLDARCQELDHHSSPAQRHGRHVRFSRPGRFYIQVVAESSLIGFRLDAWLGADPEKIADNITGRLTSDHRPRKNGEQEPDPVPQEPVDEWDELRGDVGCGSQVSSFDRSGPRAQPVTFTKNDDEEPDPVPQEPVDEWDELRSSPDGCRNAPELKAIEIQGVGVISQAQSGAELHAWCPWSSQPELLGTMTCARRLHLEQSGRIKLHRLPLHRPEMLAIELDRNAQISVIGARLAAVYNMHGKLVSPEALSTEAPSTEDSARILQPGHYFLEVDHRDSIFELSIMH